MFPVTPKDPASDKTRTDRKLRLGLMIGGICTLIAVIAILLVVFFDGREDSDTEKTAATPTVIATLTPSATPSPSPSPTPTTPPLTALGQSNPLGIEGYVYFPGGKDVPGVSNLKLFAQIPMDAGLGSQYLLHLDFLSCNEEQVLLHYTTSAAPLSDEPLYAYDSEPELTLTLGSLIPGSGAFFRKEYDDASTSIASLANGAHITSFHESGVRQFFLLDKELNAYHSHTFDDSIGTVLYTSDGKRCYFSTHTGAAELHRLKEDGSEEVLSIPKFRFSSLESVHTDEAGNDFLLLLAMAGDMREYRLIVDAQSMEVLFVTAPYDSYVESSYGTLIETFFDTESLTSAVWTVSQGDSIVDFQYPSLEEDLLEGISPYPRALSDGRLLFVQETSEGQVLSLYDLSTATLLDSICLPIEEFYYLNCLPLAENRYLISAGDAYGSQNFYVWEIDNIPVGTTRLTATMHEKGSRPSLEVSHDIDLDFFSPRPLSPELRPLKERAQKLTDRYGIQILLGEECANYINGYCIYPITDYTLIEDALLILETELAKYPDDFFLQMVPEYMEGNALYLTGDIPYHGSDNRGQSAAFRTDFQGYQIIVMNLLHLDLNKTIHHEISHIIDDFVIRTCINEDDDFFTEEGWLALNPPEDIYGPAYSYSYSRYVLSDFLYVHDRLMGYDYTDSYYVDGYSTTYPTEDRARIWENVMTDHATLDFSIIPALDAKMDYYIAGIEESFDTSGWPEENYWNLAQD